MANLSSKLTFGPARIDWLDGINLERMRRDRAEKARTVLRAHGIPTFLTSLLPEMRYLTGVIAWSANFAPMLNYALFFVDHDPVVYFHGGYYHQVVDQATWIKHFRCAHCWLGGAAGVEDAMEEANIWAAELYDEMKQRGVEKEKVAICGIDSFGQQALQKLGVTLVPGEGLLAEMKKTKTIDEINCLKMVANIAEAGWWTIWRELHPGMTDLELRNIAVKACLDRGAETVSPSFGPRSGPLSFYRGIENTGRIIQTGDLINMPLCMIQYMGYCSCTYRTLICGRRPNAQEKDWYKICLDSVNKVVDALRPGATTADAAKGFEPVKALGLEDEYEVLTTNIGHGIGIGGYNPPVINRQWSLKNPQPIEENMVIAVEAAHGVHRVGGARLEHMVWVTKDGPEILDMMPADEIWPPYFAFN